MASQESLPHSEPLCRGEPARHESYGSIEAGHKQTATWEDEYASPWMILFNTIALVGYQILSMAIVAYQVLFKRHYVMRCTHHELSAWQLWTCEYTKAFTRFFPLVAILISMSLARSMILIQRMYYELLRHGAVLQFKEYKTTREPVFYILIFCLASGASNWLLDSLTPGSDELYWTEPSPFMSTVEKVRQWLIYLVVPMTTFVLSIFFAHEPTYYLVPLSRYLHAGSTEGAEAARQRLAQLVLVQEELVAPAAKHIEVPVPSRDDRDAATSAVYRQLIKTSRDLEDGGCVTVGRKRLTVLKSQITDRYWPAKLLFNLALADEGSKQFRLVSGFYDVVCICAAAICGWIFIQHAAGEFVDIQRGEIEDVAALVVEAAHACYAVFYIYKIWRRTLIH